MTPPDQTTEAAAPTYDVDLVPTLLLRAPTPLPPLTGRVSLGTPVVRPLTAAQAAEGDGDWQGFLESQAGQYDYLLLSLVCSFRPTHDGPPSWMRASVSDWRPPMSRPIGNRSRGPSRRRSELSLSRPLPK